MSRILLFDHNQRDRQRSEDFLDKAKADFKQSMAGVKAEIAAAKAEPDIERRKMLYGGLERKLERLNADSQTLVNANKRLLGQLRDELATKWNKIEGLLAYGIACGMSSSADRFIVACLKDARETRNIEERERLWAEADLALPAAISAAEGGYGPKLPDIDQHG